MNIEKDIISLNTETDVVIIGAGPVGIFASFACGMLGLKTQIIETRNEAGGQCVSLYADKQIYDIPALNNKTAGDLIKELADQANLFNPVWNFGRTVTSIETNSEFTLVQTNRGEKIKCKSVIIAAGMGACIPNRLVFDNASIYENKQLFYHIDNPEMFKNKNVTILGGGNSAADWTLHLCKIAKKVTLIHRRSAFTAFKSSTDQFETYIRSGKLRICNESVVKKIMGNDSESNTQLFGLEIESKQGLEILDSDYILACYGLKNDISVIKSYNIEMSADKILVNPKTAMTSKERIYAVGDIADFPTKHKLFSILSGFQESTLAAHDIFEKYSDKANRNLNHHSTSLFE